MNRPFAHPGDRLGDLLADVRQVLSDPANSATLQTMPTDRPDTVARVEQELAAVLSIIDNSGSNPALKGVIGHLNKKLCATFSALDAQFVESGSSGGNIRIGIALARALAPRQQRIVALDRLAHVSAIGAIALAGLD